MGEVYEHFEFDRTYFLDGTGVSSLPEKTAKSDSEFYKELYKIVDNRDKTKGLFIMAATMQNHAPYNEYISSEIKLEKPYNKKAEIYMNSIYTSDNATLELINHFKEYDEKVIIVMFGDHFPGLPDFDKSLFEERGKTSEMEKNILTHQTPFFIWCNQNIEEKEINEISLNYLSNELMKVADIPLTPMQQELEHIKAEIPIITSWGFKDKNNKWYSRADFQSENDNNGEYQDIINEYSSICYYRLITQN